MSIVDGIMQDCEFDIIATDLARLKVKGLILEIEKCTDFDSATESTSEFTALEEAIAGYEGASDTINAHAANKNNPHEVTTTQIGAAESTHTHSTSDILSGTLPIARGGTNATTASDALSNLGEIPTTRTINSKALSSNITLNASDVGPAPYEVKFEEDFNNMKTSGLYTMVMCDNSPPGGISYNLLVNKSYDEGDFVQQIAIEESTYDVYMRYCSNTSWSNWKLFSMGGHTHGMSDITSGILPITKGGTGATTASNALSSLGGVNFSNIVQQKLYFSSQQKVNSYSYASFSFTNPFKGNTTDKILGVTSCHISGRPTTEGTGTSYGMHLVAEPQFSSSNAVGYILIYNPNTSDLYVTSDSYIVLSSVKP